MGDAPPPPRDPTDKDVVDLDDELDRDELRQRYYGLLQELRVIIPGVQVLLAFLLTAPFAQRFTTLDSRGRNLYGVALFSALVSVVCLLTPAVLHRLGHRTARQARLMVGIRLMLAGLAALAVSVTAALWCVTRLVFRPGVATTMTAVGAVVVVAAWIVLPLTLRYHREP
jgi:hypothetical protein